MALQIYIVRCQQVSWQHYGSAPNNALARRNTWLPKVTIMFLLYLVSCTKILSKIKDEVVIFFTIMFVIIVVSQFPLWVIMYKIKDVVVSSKIFWISNYLYIQI